MDRGRRIFAIEVPIGPFDEPPLELGQHVTVGFTATTEAIAAATTAWLTERLHQHGVHLGAHDYEIVSELSEDVGWDATQVVVGWVARAAQAEARMPPDSRRP